MILCNVYLLYDYVLPDFGIISQVFYVITYHDYKEISDITLPTN